MWYPTSVKTTLYLPDEIAARVRQLSIREGRSQADLIREAIGTYVAKAESTPLPGLGQFRSGGDGVGARADEILAERARETRGSDHR